MGRSFHKANVSLACLLNPTADSKSRYKHIVRTSVSIPGVHRIFHVLSHEAHFVFMVLTE